MSGMWLQGIYDGMISPVDITGRKYLLLAPCRIILGLCQEPLSYIQQDLIVEWWWKTSFKGGLLTPHAGLMMPNPVHHRSTLIHAIRGRPFIKKLFQRDYRAERVGLKIERTSVQSQTRCPIGNPMLLYKRPALFIYFACAMWKVKENPAVSLEEVEFSPYSTMGLQIMICSDA